MVGGQGLTLRPQLLDGLCAGPHEGLRVLVYLVSLGVRHLPMLGQDVADRETVMAGLAGRCAEGEAAPGGRAGARDAASGSPTGKVQPDSCCRWCHPISRPCAPLSLRRAEETVTASTALGQPVYFWEGSGQGPLIPGSESPGLTLSTSQE